jgi:hypothetical protein
VLFGSRFEHTIRIIVFFSLTFVESKTRLFKLRFGRKRLNENIIYGLRFITTESIDHGIWNEDISFRETKKNKKTVGLCRIFVFLKRHKINIHKTKSKKKRKKCIEAS